MSKTERLYRIEALIKRRGHASFAQLREVLEESPATLKRDLEYLRSRLGAPIEYDRFVNGYRIGAEVRGDKHELPGLWFDERELYALLMAHQLLSGLDSDGVLSRHLQPLLERIHQMLGAAGGSGRADAATALLERVRIVSAARRPVPSRFFELVTEALLKRRRLVMRYLSRGRGEVSDRPLPGWRKTGKDSNIQDAGYTVPEWFFYHASCIEHHDMSYLVLARKWRPQGFDDLIGQEPITRILKNAIEQGKIAHAYLFSGPRGVGKTSTARILAKALNSQSGPTSSPCGSCPFCTSITDGSSVDVMEIDGASNNSVNDVRDLRERVKYVPSGGRYKVYIIDETHMLSYAAFNALLKTLEEPPAHAIFILATTAPRKIPSTVLSRCQHLVISPLPKEHRRR